MKVMMAMVPIQKPYAQQYHQNGTKGFKVHT
jgi:hypothetical protein